MLYREVKQGYVTGTLGWGMGKSQTDSEKVTFNLSLNNEKQPAFNDWAKNALVTSAKDQKQ